MKCECADCAFCGMELCQHRKLMDENNALRKTIMEAKSRMTYYYGNDMPPMMQNVYDVLSRNDNQKGETT